MALGGSAELLASSACSTTTTVNAALVSGIFIQPQLLLGGLGCSGPPDANELDVYRYVAVAMNDVGDIAGAGVFECYEEAVIANLPGTDGGSLNFAVWVYAYNYQQWNADPGLAAAVTELNAVNQPDGSVVVLSARAIPDGGLHSAIPSYASALSTICTSKATWVTTCSATSQASVQTLADCRPLQLQTAVPTACNLPILLPDAAVDARRD